LNLSMFSLENKVSVITGAARGLGRAISKAFAEAGADIFAVDILDQFDDTLRDVESVGRRIAVLRTDLSDMTSIPRVVEEAIEAFGRIDILFNNAGIIRRANMLEFSEQDWDDVMNLNVKTAFLLSQAVARVFVSQGGGGKIINVCSMLSFQGGLYVPSYTASKSALLGITKSMANELAPLGINVNAIAPGYIAGVGNQAIRDDPVRNRQILDRIPAGRWGRYDELAGLAIYLASPASDYCHGGVYPVDGGWLAR
jgi:2-deoxy-D-gluconate 3-dehydrogenase